MKNIITLALVTALCLPMVSLAAPVTETTSTDIIEELYAYTQTISAIFNNGLSFTSLEQIADETDKLYAWLVEVSENAGDANVRNMASVIASQF